MKQVNLKIKGMTCTSCAINIEKTLKKLKGIKKIAVNFGNEKVNIEYDTKYIDIKEIEQKIIQLGYNIINENDNDIQENIDLIKSKNIMIKSLILTTIIMSLMMINMFLIKIPGYIIITAILGFPIIFGIGRDVHKASYKAIKNKVLNMDVLVSLGSIPPYLIGLLGLFFPVQTFIEMATTIMTFHIVGKYLEVRAKGRASQAIKKLLQMGAKTARIIVDNEETEISVNELKINDIMIVRPGEKIPTDGIVLDGISRIDESMATGESMPIKKEKGDEVIGSTINNNGILKIKVTKVGKDTFLSQIIKLVEECQGSKVPIQEFADKITSYFVPIIIFLTILTFISYNIFPDFHFSIISWGANFLPWVNINLSPLTLSFVTATAVLVIACPCALGLGTPTALMVGSGKGAEMGILIKNGEAVQTLKDIKAIAFDKTGTITKGKPEVNDIVIVEKTTEKQLLYIAGTIEKASEHPISNAIVEKASSNNIGLGEVTEFENIVGMGVCGIVEKKLVLVGNRKLMEKYNISYSKIEKDIIKMENDAKTTVIVAYDKKILGLISVSDPIKKDSIEAIRILKNMGIKTIMITGDNKRTANAIANSVSINQVISDVLPNEKVETIKQLQHKYGIVAMVGDGINDAPALKQANIGIAIGTGTDIAIESSDVTLVSGELTKAVTAIKLSKSIFKKIKENYFWAWFYNAVAIPIAMLGLLHPMIGAAAMAISSVSVVTNSLRLNKFKV